MVPTRNDGFDFSDGAQPPLDAHPDINFETHAPQPTHLQRNRTERKRLQGLQRSNTSSTKSVTPYEPQTLKDKWDLWMINEGGKRLFFAVWVFLHLLVAVFGFLNYGLKDNLTQARALFGITFSASAPSSLL
jgi:NADPH oxidase 2